MKLIDNILWIEYSDFITCGWNENTLKNANFRNGNRWQMIQNPEDKRKPLVKYDTLVDSHKAKLKEVFKDPYDYIAKEPIRLLVEQDAKAEQFFKDYRYGDDSKPLPDDYIKWYTNECGWLNMLLKCDVAFIKKTLRITQLPTFYEHVADMLKVEKEKGNITSGHTGFPTSYQRMKALMSDYQQNGYGVLVSSKFGNKIAAKLGKTDDGFDAQLHDKQMSVIRKLANLHNNLDAVQITSLAQPLFVNNGWTPIGANRMKQILLKIRPQTISGARGKKAYNNEIAMQVKRKRPEYPLYYCTLDGWTVELLYRTEDNKYSRLVVVIVLDPYNNYPLGYAIGERENVELIKQANRNALLHINQLFDMPYRPWQLQSDNYGLKSMTPYYQAMSKLHTPAAVGNAKSKVIEPYFKYLNKKYCQLQFNWSGFNVTAQQRNQPNSEMLNAVKKHLPTKDEVIGQIMVMMDEERKLKVQDYKQRWNEMPAEDKVLMKNEDLLMLFGKLTGYTNTITGIGLQPTINGTKMLYDSFDTRFRSNMHLKWQVVYDESNLSQVVAVSEDGKLRVVLDEKRSIPMDVKSMTPEDHQFLAQIGGFNSSRKEELVQQAIEDDAVMAEVMESTPLNLDDFQELSLKLMFTDNKGQQKEGIQDAKGLPPTPKKLKAPVEEQEPANDNWQAKRMAYMQSKIDQE